MDDAARAGAVRRTEGPHIRKDAASPKQTSSAAFASGLVKREILILKSLTCSAVPAACLNKINGLSGPVDVGFARFGAGNLDLKSNIQVL
jgi:hypothetical protein